MNIEILLSEHSLISPFSFAKLQIQEKCHSQTLPCTNQASLTDFKF